MDLTQRGFQVETSADPIQGKLLVDLSHFRRVFENLFSNVRKYADPACPVTITNRIRHSTTRVESNRIGLQTCHKLVHAMGGEFNQSRTKEMFSVEVLLPLHGTVDS